MSPPSPIPRRRGPGRDRPHRAPVLLVLACLGIVFPHSSLRAEGGESTPAPVVDTATRVQELHRRADPKKQKFLNTRRAEWLGEQYGRVTDFAKRFELFHRSAEEWVKAGKTEKGIERLTSMLTYLSSRTGVPPEVERAIRYSLAVASLRLAEQENCCAQHGVDSCIFPIRGGGIHTALEGARGAEEQLAFLLEREPEDLALRWLLNLVHMTLGDYPEGVPEAHRLDPSLFASEAPCPRFLDIAPRSGLDTVSLAGGANVDDFDGDGDLDVIASSWGLLDPIRFFRNDGKGNFAEVTAEVGLERVTGGLNTVHADHDGDGDLDLLVLRGAWLGGEGCHPNTLLRNDDGVFVDVTAEAGLVGEHPTQTAAWADFDRDGDIDLFIGNESGKHGEHPCQLFRNEGDGTFVDIAPAVGADHVAYVKGVTWGDFDEDGDPDLYLSTLGSANVLLRNDGPDSTTGTWRFTDATEEAGVAEPTLSFATWSWDYDDDGDLDLLACSYGSFEESMLDVIARDYLGLPHTDECIRLYRNRGDGTFDDVSEAVGLDHAVMAMGANFGDLDNDGWLDAYFGTGQPDLATLIPNRMFRNAGGEHFEDVTTVGGFGHLQKGHGIAFADIDGDGDQDVFAVMGGAYEGDTYPNVLFENPGNDHHWVTLRLVGTTSNADALGARVRLDLRHEDGSTRTLHRVVTTGGSFGCSSLQLEVGLGNATTIEQVVVRWPAGETQTYRGIAIDRVHVLTEGIEDPTPAAPESDAPATPRG